MRGEVTRSGTVRATTLVAGAIAMLVACGGQQAEHVTAQLFGSGSRLVASYWETPGGVRVFSSWYDTELDTTCAFRSAEDGVLRCLPSGLYARTPSDDATALTRDCGSQLSPAPWVIVGACVGGLIGGGGVQDCSAIPSLPLTGCAIYRTGALISQNPATLTGIAGDSSGIEGHFALGEHVPPTDFVGATAHDERVGARLGQRRYVAEDHAWQVVGIVDTTKKGDAASCAPTAMTNGELSCVHTDLLTSDNGAIFADASCTDGVAQTCSDAPPSLGERLVLDETTCSYTSELFTVGAEVAVSEVYSASSSACISFVSAPTGHFYEVGATVVPDPAVDVMVRAVGSGRVQPEFYTLPDGALLERSQALAIHDTQRGSECSLPFGVSHDGTVQCVPQPSGQVVPPAKAACPELVAAPPSGCPARPSRPVIGVRVPVATDACARLKMPFEYVEVGAEITPSVECTPAGLQGPFYAVGARIDAASFATVTYAKDKPR